MNLPKPIAAYLAADGDDDDAFAECFAANATVRDEGKTYKGLAAIRQWKAEATKKYQYTIETLTYARKDDKSIVTNRLSGNFPGSPVELQFVFGLDGDRIVSLEIHP